MAWDDGLDRNSVAFRIGASESARLRVIAGPGTGKSFAMKRRVARLLEQAVDPASVLPVTFTRVAAEDLHRELVGLGVPGSERLQGRTLHSLSLRILSRNNVLRATGRIPRPLNQFEIEPLIHDLPGRFGACAKRDGADWHMRLPGPDSSTSSPATHRRLTMLTLKQSCWLGYAFTTQC